MPQCPFVRHERWRNPTQVLFLHIFVWPMPHSQRYSRVENAVEIRFASTADYLLSFYGFLWSQRPPQNLCAGKRERVVCVAALCHRRSTVWLLRAWPAELRKLEIAWKPRFTAKACRNGQCFVSFAKWPHEKLGMVLHEHLQRLHAHFTLYTDGEKKHQIVFWKIILPNALRCAVFTCKLSDIVEGPRFSELMELSFSLVPGFCSFNLHHDFPAELCVTLFDAPPLLQLSLRNHPRNNSTLPSQEQRSIDHLSILDSKCLGLQKVTRVTRISKTQHIVFASSFRYHQMDSFVHRLRGWIPYESLIECTLRIPAADGLGWKALILGWTDGLQASLLVTLVSSYLFVFFCPANSLVIQQLSPFAFLSSTLNEKRAACLPQS